MDSNALIRALETAIAEIQGDHLAARNPKLSEELREILTDGERGKAILTTLEVQPEFQNRAPMINSLTGLSGFQSQFVAPALVREARQRKSAREAVLWLQKVLGTESAAGIVVQSLWGLAPEKETALLENITLIPFDSLPDSRQKERLKSNDATSSLRYIEPAFAWAPPTAALVARMEVRPFLVDASKDLSNTNNDRFDRKLDEIRLCLSLEGPSMILPGPSWFQYVDQDLEAALLGSTSSFGHHEVMPLHFAQNPSVEAAEDAPAIVQAYMALEATARSRIYTALGRLHQALLRTYPADSAVELSIALEALLVNNPGEHTFKIGLRAALLGSDTIDARIADRAIIEAAYGMRSGLMHSGEVPKTVKVKGRGRMPDAEVVRAASIITARVIKRIIMNGGSLSDWNQLELSGGTSGSSAMLPTLVEETAKRAASTAEDRFAAYEVP